MITAAPVAALASGRYGVIDGCCTFEMTCSPSGVSRTASGAEVASAPGAPFGQSLIGVGCAAATTTDTQRTKAAKQHLKYIADFKVTSKGNRNYFYRAT